MTQRDIVQQEAETAWNNTGCRGTVVGATGIGKTKLAINIIERFLEETDAPLLHDPVVYIVVPTEVLRDTGWPDEFEKWGKPEYTKATKRICYASLVNLKNEVIDLLIFDEFHHTTVTNMVVMSNNKVHRVLGLTATYPDKNELFDQDKFAILNSIAPPIFHMPLDEAVESELVADFDVKILKFFLDDLHKTIPSGTKKRPFMTTEKKHYAYLTKQIQFATMKMKADPKMAGMKFSYMQKRTMFLYNLETKVRLARECINNIATKGQRTLVFAGGIEQSKQLCGEDVFNSKSTDEALLRFQRKEINVLGVVNALDEGANIVDLDQSLIVQLSSSKRRLVQRIGRNIRFREGHKALIVVLVACKTVDEKWCDNAFADFDKKRIKVHMVRVPDGDKLTAV